MKNSKVIIVTFSAEWIINVRLIMYHTWKYVWNYWQFFSVEKKTVFCLSVNLCTIWDGQSKRPMLEIGNMNIMGFVITWILNQCTCNYFIVDISPDAYFIALHDTFFVMKGGLGHFCIYNTIIIKESIT